MNDFDEDLNVDLTPLIDVTFMLVIFFIMTMSFTIPVIDITLPESSTSEVSEQQNVINVTINKEGTILVKDEVYTKEMLINYIETHENVTISLFVDKETQAQYLVTMADIARKYTKGRLIINTSKVEQ